MRVLNLNMAASRNSDPCIFFERLRMWCPDANGGLDTFFFYYTKKGEWKKFSRNGPNKSTPLISRPKSPEVLGSLGFFDDVKAKDVEIRLDERINTILVFEYYSYETFISTSRKLLLKALSLSFNSSIYDFLDVQIVGFLLLKRGTFVKFY